MPVLQSEDRLSRLRISFVLRDRAVCLLAALKSMVRQAMTTPDDVATPVTPARERILSAAYDLFSRRGIRAVGTDEVIERAGVAKATLYRHFATKNDLVLAVLERREELWTHGLIEAQSEQRGNTPEDRLLWLFDVL